MRIFKTIDWKFCAALSVLLMVAYIIVDGERDEQQQVQTITILRERAATEDKQQAEKDKAATEERTALLEGQRRIEQKYDALLGRQIDLIEWLQENDIDVPPELTVVTESSGTTSKKKSSAAPSSTDQPGKGKGKGKASLRTTKTKGKKK